ncbi:MAG: DUF1513 domain-containing protein [Pseudomonadota bacterium]
MEKFLAPSLRRRDVLLAIAGSTLFAPALPVQASPPISSERWVSAHGGETEDFGLGWVGSGKLGGNASTGFRGHAVLQHPLRPESVIFLPRRPGKTALEVDLSTGTVLRKIHSEQDRHFFGHGCFSSDGSVLFTTEAQISAGLGRITLRDSSSYALLDEWSSFGIGPHDMAALPDGKTLVVANGGILTRPDSGRKALNLPTMRSSLCYLDAASGMLIDEFFVDEPKASIRHLDVASDGTVAFAIQVQREATGHDRLVPLIGAHRPGGALELFAEPEAITFQLKDYVGSVAIANESGLAAYASPRGNIVVFFDLKTGALAGYHQLRDVCGLAVSPAHRAFVITNSFGEMRELDWSTLLERRESRLRLPQIRWDNHLLITAANHTA